MGSTTDTLATWLGELRQTVRALARSPGFACLAVLTLAAGLGPAIAIFSVVNAALLRPLPFREPDRLAAIFLRMPGRVGAESASGDGAIDMVWSYPKYEAMLGAQRVFADLAPHVADAFALRGDEGAESVSGESVGAGYFDVLGVRPRLGRGFRRDEDRAAGGERVVVLGDGLWRRRFGGDPRAIGQRVELDGRLYTVVGVAPPSFRGLSGNASLWVLYTASRPATTLRARGAHQFGVVARLAPGVEWGAARQAATRLGEAVERVFPADDGRAWGAALYALDERRVDPTVRRAVQTLAVAVALLLAIACVNVANVLLARGAARGRELATRLAIGATPERIARQLLTEGVVLAALGVALGLAVALVAVRLLAAAAPLDAADLSGVRGSLTRLALGGIALDARAAAFAGGAALLVGAVVGLVPALAARRTSVADALRDARSSAGGFGRGARPSVRGALVVAQVALAVVLLVASGLTLRSLSRLLAVPAGYEPGGVLAARVTLSPLRYRGDSAGPMWDAVVRGVAALPGVRSVGVGSCAPVGDHCDGTGIRVAGRSIDANVSYHAVSPEWFRALGTPLLRGRAFTDDDRRGAPPVAIVNAAAARLVWGADDPLATPIVGRGEQPIRIVGVVGDARYENLEREAAPAVFFPLAQSGRRRMMMVVRTDGDPASLAGAVRRAVTAADPGHVVAELSTMERRLVEATALQRFTARVIGAFASVALLVAAIGLYGVLALLVARRTREIGIRVALGAARRRVLALVVAQAMGLAAMGAAAGVVAAYLVARAMGGVLYGVGSADPASYLWAVGALMLAALVAAGAPALRAARISPMVAMRSE